MKKDYFIIFLIMASVLVSIVSFNKNTEIKINISSTGFDNVLARELNNQLIDEAFPEYDLDETVEKDICNDGVLKKCALTSAYGPRIHPIFDRLLFHHGIDLAVVTGSPIWAPADGVVVSAGVRGGYGMEVTIDHGYGWISRYAHLDKILVRKGKFIKKGEVLGRVGSTGLSTGPHLHFEIRYQETPVDPRIYFQALDSFNSLFAWRKTDSQNS